MEKGDMHSRSAESASSVGGGVGAVVLAPGVLVGFSAAAGTGMQTRVRCCSLKISCFNSQAERMIDGRRTSPPGACTIMCSSEAWYCKHTKARSHVQAYKLCRIHMSEGHLCNGACERFGACAPGHQTPCWSRSCQPCHRPQERGLQARSGPQRHLSASMAALGAAGCLSLSDSRPMFFEHRLRRCPCPRTLARTEAL